MSDYLSPSELAELTGYKKNQRAAMCNWLDDRRWMYVTNKIGMPMVLRRYRDSKLGLSNEKTKPKLSDEPNIAALDIR
ncbi:DUF4224 domain-containing protein [Oligella urethralis]|uniref:DUF4224 domain-containing protein n=1 Tax=Oligella urethralis TaxID=90245 RepID=UPI00288BF36A|nr:DUF4224 domain-containing protein [Oligella urethralis]